MSKGVSIREFARREECSDTLVRRAIKAGRLQAFDDGTLDPDLVGTGWRATAPSRANTAVQTANTQVRTEVFAGSQPDDDGEDDSLEAKADRLMANGQVPTHAYAEALRIKENYLALLKQLEYEQKSGALVPLEDAETILFDQARAQRDAWLNWPTRVGPLIAAELGLEADLVTGVLTGYVHKHIGQLGQPEADVEFIQQA